MRRQTSMKSATLFKALWSVSALALMSVPFQRVNAEGLRLYGYSTEAQMRGEAIVASVDDAGAAWYNPAALTTIPKSDLSINLNNLFLSIKYSDTAGREEKNKRGYFPIPGLYYGSKIGTGRFAYGLALNSPFGLATEYSKASAFRYITTGGEITLFNVNPSLAFQVNPKFSVGLGVAYYHSTAELGQQYPWAAIVPGSPDGEVKIKGTGDGFGFNTGIVCSPSERSTVGITYRSQVAIKYDGDQAELTNIPAPIQALAGVGSTYKTGAETSLRFPDIIGMGYALKGDHWVWEIGGQWTNWNDFRTADVHLDQPTSFFPDSSTPFYWKNSWVIRTGLEYGLSETWSVAGGYFFDKSPTRESTYGPLVPDGDHHVLSTGAVYKKRSFALRLPLVLIIQTGSNSINSDLVDVTGTQNVDGKYELIGFQFGLGMSYTFGS